MASGPQYNVLLIISEDNGQHLGCYGDPFVQTPNLDKFASEGVLFDNMHTTQAVCSPGRASILTGLYPHQNGQFGLATHKYALYDDFPNMQRLLKDEGYRTGLIGKLHINPEDAFPFDLWWNPKEFISFANRDVRKMAEVAGDFMEDSDEPFFLQISFPDAHLPLHRQQFGLPAQPLEGKDVETLPQVGIDGPRLREETADYYNCMSRLDTGVGLVLERLEAMGKADQTLVIFTTDHGAQFSRGKTSIYEGGLRIPLIVRCPGLSLAGHVCEELMSQVDILPTVTEVLGINSPAGLVGESFVSLLKGEDRAWRTHLFAEWTSGSVDTYFPQRSVRDERYKLIVNLLRDRPSPSALGYKSPGRKWKPGATEEEIAAADEHIRVAYGLYENPPAFELYDLQKDPWEFENLAGNRAYAAVLQCLKNQLVVWQEETNDALRHPENLECLTKKHDDLVEEFYQHSRMGGSRAFEWEYTEYMHEP